VYHGLRNRQSGVVECLTVATKKTAAATGSSARTVAKKREVTAHHLKTVPEAWHRCRMFAVKHEMTVSQCFEAAFLVIWKYEEQPEMIGPKFFEALKKWKEAGRKESLDIDDL
jgi:hypothetical protein